MNIFPDRMRYGFTALVELGPGKVFYFVLYQLAIKLKVYHLLAPCKKQNSKKRTKDIKITPKRDFYNFPTKIPNVISIKSIIADNTDELIKEADQIVKGQCKYFGAYFDQIDLIPKNNRFSHWSTISDKDQDLKFTWEPARFGWVFTLGRAYLVSGNEQYAATFWELFEIFINNNPVNCGPNWMSSQEVALRILAFSFGAQLFKDSIHSSETKIRSLYQAIFEHAKRIPPTLIYAKSQNNNHLLSEAAGLYTAGVIFKNTRKGRRWQNTGWRLFNQGLQKQISDDGSYIQNSTNYHRLMLHLSLWIYYISSLNKMPFPKDSINKLGQATKWLLSLTDASSGHVSNLGHNDGSNILPLTVCDQEDFRPVIQAASCAYLDKKFFSYGPWDELSNWFDINTDLPLSNNEFNTLTPSMLRIGSNDNWGYLRAATFKDRPAHADQLQVDLWWKGENIALDAGTFRYTDQGLWKNVLANTNTHNTIMIEDKDQMTHAGRFLWLDWAQSRIVASDIPNCITAEHDGYKKMGITHRRSLIHERENEWHIIDEIYSKLEKEKETNIVLHWLIEDLPYESSSTGMQLHALNGNIQINFEIYNQDNKIQPVNKQLIRAGELISGSGKHPKSLGWFSPSYNIKIPALSIRLLYNGFLPVTIHSRWKFTEYSQSSQS